MTELATNFLRLFGSLAVWLFGCLVVWLVGWLVGWLAGWLVGWWVGGLVGWLVGCWLLVVGCCCFGKGLTTSACMSTTT